MSQALFTSMTGLNTAQQAINVVSNNVANINTTAYKSADARFATLFSNTLSAGNAPSATAGGTNPKQIGLGVKLEGISRNFETGSFLSTGHTSDSMISGSGYYTVMDASGNVFLTRDGAFTLDANGDMITANGLKVLGAKELTSETSSQTAIHIPQSFSRKITGDSDLLSRQMSELNNSSYTTGTMNFRVVNGDGDAIELSINITEDNSGDVQLTDSTNYKTFMDNLVKAVNDKVKDYCDNQTPAITTIPTVSIDYNVDPTKDNCGTVSLKIADGGTDPSTFEILNTSTSNIAQNLTFYKVSEGEPQTSKQVAQVVSVDPAASTTNMTSLSSYTIGSDGSIEASYDNGDKLTVYLDDASQFQFQYVTAAGVYIMGNNSDTSPVTINPNVCTEDSMVMQIATVTNEAGLVSQADNLWTIGPDTGKTYYTMAGQMGTGDIVTGGLEGSNVDLARELSNMIIAQRAINANSRVFGTASTIMETLSQLGR